MERWVAKLLALCGCFVLPLFCTLLPRAFSSWVASTEGDRGRHKRILGWLICVGGGIFFGTYLLHMGPEVRKLLKDSLLDPYHIDYPLPDLLVGLGFLLVLFAEKIVLRWNKARMERRSLSRGAAIRRKSAGLHDDDDDLKGKSENLTPVSDSSDRIFYDNEAAESDVDIKMNGVGHHDAALLSKTPETVVFNTVADLTEHLNHHHHHHNHKDHHHNHPGSDQKSHSNISPNQVTNQVPNQAPNPARSVTDSVDGIEVTRFGGRSPSPATPPTNDTITNDNIKSEANDNIAGDNSNCDKNNSSNSKDADLNEIENSNNNNNLQNEIKDKKQEMGSRDDNDVINNYIQALGIELQPIRGGERKVQPISGEERKVQKLDQPIRKGENDVQGALELQKKVDNKKTGSDDNIDDDDDKSNHSNHSDHHHLQHHHSHHDTRSIVLILALSLHRIFEGMSIGLQQSLQNTWSLFIAVMCHETVIGFSLGLQLVKSDLSTRRLLVTSLVCSSIMPVGVAVGILMTEAGAQSVAVEIANGVLQAIAMGTFIYVTFFEILQEELDPEDTSMGKVISVAVGFFLMALLTLLPEEQDELISDLGLTTTTTP